MKTYANIFWWLPIRCTYNLPTHIPVASKAVRSRAKSVHKTQVKGKGKSIGKGKSDKTKPGKAAIVISSDSEESLGEVDFPHFPPNQPAELPAEEPEEPNQPLDIPVEGPGEPEEPNNSNPLPENLPIPMANNQLNCCHFKPDFQKNQKKMQRHTYWEQMSGWAHMISLMNKR